MSRFRFLAPALAVLAGVLMAPAAAGAQSGQLSLPDARAQSIPVQFAGQLTVAFHGDASSGCASSGLCGYVGTVSWRPPPAGQLEVLSYRRHGRIEHQVSVSPESPSNYGGANGGVATAQVELTSSPPARSPDCLDTTTTGGQITLPVGHGDVTFTLAGATPSLIQTRCAGPRMADVLPEIPAPAIVLSRVLRGMTTIALPASGTFSSHGFAGTVSSTLAIQLGRPGPAEPISSGTSSANPYHYRQLEVTYRASLAGSMVERIRGDADTDACALLGSCGVLGTLTLLPRVSGAEAEITAMAPGRTPIRDLRGVFGLTRSPRARDLTASGEASWTGGGTILADLRQGSATCTDSAPLGPGGIVLEAEGKRLAAGYEPASAATRCPGPEFNAAPVLAGGVTPIGRLARRTIKISLTLGPRLEDYGYTGQAIPHLTLTLTRTTG